MEKQRAINYMNNRLIDAKDELSRFRTALEKDAFFALADADSAMMAATWERILTEAIDYLNNESATVEDLKRVYGDRVMHYAMNRSHSTSQSHNYMEQCRITVYSTLVDRLM